MNIGDILVEIPNHDLPKLAALFEEKAPWAPYMVSFVHTAIKWKENSKYKSKIVFLSPYNCWEEDGTIIARIQLVTQDFFVFTLDDQCTNLYKGLVENNLITHGANIRSQFYGVHEKHVPTVKKYLETKQIKVVDDIPCFIYAMTPEEAKKFTFEYVHVPLASKEEGHWPLGTILLENEKSIAMFEKLGFHNIGICNFIIF